MIPRWSDVVATKMIEDITSVHYFLKSSSVLWGWASWGWSSSLMLKLVNGLELVIEVPGDRVQSCRGHLLSAASSGQPIGFSLD